ncbi:hypothetical protein VKT23_006333 [Stygiomarasmius scandens]|uniref:Uncharacterized protein n=1 Tax=Marasmiellus scandens TaxID=2682957 RepID=A0ABR1JNU2_9AGAR
MTSMTTRTLLSPNGYLLAYALPLFFASLVLTFAGAFLTLDRSRSFAPRYDALSAQKTKKFNFVFEGGVDLATWLLSSLPLTFLGVQYKYAAPVLVRSGVLAFNERYHLSFVTDRLGLHSNTHDRPHHSFEKRSHFSLRFAGFICRRLEAGVVDSFTRKDSGLDRSLGAVLVEGWGSNKEQGLSAGFCLFWASQWTGY